MLRNIVRGEPELQRPFVGHALQRERDGSRRRERPLQPQTFAEPAAALLRQLGPAFQPVRARAVEVHESHHVLVRRQLLRQHGIGIVPLRQVSGEEHVVPRDVALAPRDHFHGHGADVAGDGHLVPCLRPRGRQREILASQRLSPFERVAVDHDRAAAGAPAPHAEMVGSVGNDLDPAHVQSEGSSWGRDDASGAPARVGVRDQSEFRSGAAPRPRPAHRQKRIRRLKPDALAGQSLQPGLGQPGRRFKSAVGQQIGFDGRRDFRHRQSEQHREQGCTEPPYRFHG